MRPVNKLQQAIENADEIRQRDVERAVKDIETEVCAALDELHEYATSLIANDLAAVAGDEVSG